MSGVIRGEPLLSGLRRGVAIVESGLLGVVTLL